MTSLSGILLMTTDDLITLAIVGSCLMELELIGPVQFLTAVVSTRHAKEYRSEQYILAPHVMQDEGLDPFPQLHMYHQGRIVGK
jgi:hypothetical protein